MPPADTNAPATAPTPVPEPPKKQGFFARLFGGKKAATPVVPANFESQTPAPQLDDAPGAVESAPIADPMATPPAVDAMPAASVSTEQPASVPSEPVSPVPPAPTQPTEPMPEPSDPTPPAGPVPPVQ